MATSHVRRTGAAIASFRKSSSSGKAAKAGCTTGCAIAAVRTVIGSSNASRRRPLSRKRHVVCPFLADGWGVSVCAPGLGHSLWRVLVMLRRCMFLALPVLTLTVLLLVPDTSFAQRYGRRGGVSVNVGGGYPYYGGSSWGYGRYGYGYPYYGGSGIGVYGRNFGVTVGGYPYYGASPYW